MKLISRIAGLAAVTHLSLFPLLDAQFRDRVARDPFFSVQAYQMGYYSAIMCGPGASDRPHSPYHQNNPACHAFIFSGRDSKRRNSGCCNPEEDGLDMHGVPGPNSSLAKRKGMNWTIVIALAQAQNPKRFVPRGRKPPRFAPP